MTPRRASSAIGRQGHQRDRDVRRVGSLRALVVGGAVSAPLGVAGVLGLTALTAQPSTSSAQPSQPPASTGGTTKSGLVADLQSFGSGGQLSNGSGHTHATTKGS